MIESNPAEAEEASTRPVHDVRPAPIFREEHAEGSLTRILEQQTVKIPSHWFLGGALGSMVAALGLEVVGRSRLSRMVGMWAPTLLIMGLYNKLVKMLGPR